MKRNMEIGVIGIGKFGLQLSKSLQELGHLVVGLDKDKDLVQRVQNSFAKVYTGDATDKDLLEQLRFQDFSAVVVSVGSSMEESILIALNLQELNVRRIIVKSVGVQHKKILKKLGVHRVIEPETEVAIQTAYRLAHPGMLEYVAINGGVLLQELTINFWAEKTLAELNLLERFFVSAVAIKQQNDEEFRFKLAGDIQLFKGDKLLVIGKQEDIAKIEA